MAEHPRFPYGGQAVMEGVMIRGRRYFSLAVRRPNGAIARHHEQLNPIYNGRPRRFPIIRGVVALAETLVLGVKSLHYSANLATQNPDAQVQEEMSGWALGGTLAFSVVVAVGLFFLLPLFLVELMDPRIPSSVASNVIEGLLRLAILLGYIWAIGFLKDIRRVFAYHGAEHMTVHTLEAGLALTVENVRKFGTPHPRCGTAFLLTVALVSIVVFAFLGRPPIEWRILSRIVLIPVIAGISYEIIRYSGAHYASRIGYLMAQPGLLLQRLTTRQPDDSQIEVAICAMETAIAADEGREYTPGQPEAEPSAG